MYYEDREISPSSQGIKYRPPSDKIGREREKHLARGLAYPITGCPGLPSSHSSSLPSLFLCPFLCPFLWSIYPPLELDVYRSHYDRYSSLAVCHLLWFDRHYRSIKTNPEREDPACVDRTAYVAHPTKPNWEEGRGGQAQRIHLWSIVSGHSSIVSGHLLFRFGSNPVRLLVSGQNACCSSQYSGTRRYNASLVFQSSVVPPGNDIWG